MWWGVNAGRGSQQQSLPLLGRVLAGANSSPTPATLCPAWADLKLPPLCHLSPYHKAHSKPSSFSLHPKYGGLPFRALPYPVLGFPLSDTVRMTATHPQRHLSTATLLTCSCEPSAIHTPRPSVLAILSF